MGENGPQAKNPAACIACGQCVAVCPQGAIDGSSTPLAKQVPLDKKLKINAPQAAQFLRSRRSIRHYRQTAVPKEHLLKLIDIARFAPTASNGQGISYIIVQDKAVLKKAVQLTVEWMEAELATKPQVHWSFPKHVRIYRETGLDSILRDAPCLVLAAAQKDNQRGRENTIFSLAYLELYAPALDLGSCWAGLLEACLFSKYEPLLNLFSIPKDKVITGAVMVGYPEYRYQRIVERNPLDITWQ
jgi:nitroreductase